MAAKEDRDWRALLERGAISDTLTATSSTAAPAGRKRALAEDAGSADLLPLLKRISVQRNGMTAVSALAPIYRGVPVN